MFSTKLGQALLLAISIKGCSASLINTPTIPGVTFTDVQAVEHQNYSLLAENTNPEQFYDTTISFCNITLWYTHQGWNDNIAVTVWIPLTGWDGRMRGVGGSGFSVIANLNRLAPGVGNSSATVATNGGHGHNTSSADTWGLDNSSRVNFMYAQTFFAVAEAEAAVIGKSVITDMFGASPRYSYFDGCSTGGRQALMLAQQYPDLYDGILSGSPAINWASFVPGMYYPQFVMNQLQHYPYPCILDAINNASIIACDILDGAVDGIISNPYQCNYSASAAVGRTVYCKDTGKMETITESDAEVADKIWEGPKSSISNSQLWYPMSRGTSFSNIANVTNNGTAWTGAPFLIAVDWINRFVFQNANYPIAEMPASGFEDAYDLSVKAWRHVSSTDNPDLSGFQAAGGKLIHWHGLADQQIFEEGSRDYYNKCMAHDPLLREYYRFFEAPGAAHCGVSGLIPTDAMSYLIQWVEDGVAPDELPASTPDGAMKRRLCEYPKVAAYRGGNVTLESSFHCQESF
ncbi:putative feruloyl esterase [Talaromyces proteolyticus]|uniref:Carboxylic ester hydrolase n=1 Tax=Talaromyces proteolyticus TaxID=1131652 RepID=A0AAD4KIU6_9EURO|nr:putative feruloyl esterase [Talaromyces proteolyticus]KAH8689333.1 putative feruloyl esterase [Talaromyces proteolyticus]